MNVCMVNLLSAIERDNERVFEFSECLDLAHETKHFKKEEMFLLIRLL